MLLVLVVVRSKWCSSSSSSSSSNVEGLINNERALLASEVAVIIPVLRTLMGLVTERYK